MSHIDAAVEAMLRPLGPGRAYHSIGHLPGSTMAGSRDRAMGPKEAARATYNPARGTVVRVMEKVDGSCVGIARVGDRIVPITRSGYHARSSRYQQHHMFADYVAATAPAWLHALQDGERLMGEWLAQAHGTAYLLEHAHEALVVFDLMRQTSRLALALALERVAAAEAMYGGQLTTVPRTWEVMDGEPLHQYLRMGMKTGIDLTGEPETRPRRPAWQPAEGLVYRVEHTATPTVAMLAKWVRPGYVPGRYLPVRMAEDACSSLLPLQESTWNYMWTPAAPEELERVRDDRRNWRGVPSSHPAGLGRFDDQRRDAAAWVWHQRQVERAARSAAGADAFAPW
jgi:hypothetical protein